MVFSNEDVQTAKFDVVIFFEVEVVGKDWDIFLMLSEVR
jgi:hypothetical protein